jgi:bacillithiol biosynthesis cysteine-adding enzyme BshC
MKFERETPPVVVGHPLGAALRDYASAFVRERYPHPPSLEGTIAAARGLPPASAEVVDRLVRENVALGHPNAAAAADPLRRGAAIVVAGQQPGLFGGTLLTFEKAAAAVSAAAAATAAGTPCVALFWSQSEDHDLDEVNRYEREDEAGYVRLTAPIADEGRRLGDLRIDEGVVAWARERLTEAGAGSAFAAIEPRAGERYSDWSLRVVVALLAPRGLLVADPRWFRDLLTPFLHRAIDGAAAWHAAFRADTELVRAAGFEPQVDGGAAGGLFLVDEAGRRRRLAAGADGRWTRDDGRSYSAAELRALASAEPDRFSPNVQLRPLAQQFLLPVAAQIGGPAETAYFAQFPGAYRAAGLPLPATVPRPSSTVLGVKEAKARDALGLDARALLTDPATWPAEPDADAATAELFARVAAAEESAWEPLAAAADNDPLRRAVDGFRERGRAQREKLRDTFRREAERKSGVERNRRRRLTEWVRPKGRPQERVLLLPHLLARASVDALRGWLAALDPFDRRHVICTFGPEDLP